MSNMVAHYSSVTAVKGRWTHPVLPLAKAQTAASHNYNETAYILNTGSNLGLYYKLKQSHEYLLLSPACEWPLQGCWDSPGL